MLWIPLSVDYKRTRVPPSYSNPLEFRQEHIIPSTVSCQRLQLCTSASPAQSERDLSSVERTLTDMLSHLNEDNVDAIELLRWEKLAGLIIVVLEKKNSTRDQSVVEQCMTLFECHHVHETIRERKRKFLQKFRMSSNQLCVTFRDKASADLELQ